MTARSSTLERHHQGGNTATRVLAFLYGLVAYLTFFGTILYAIGFVTGLVVPKTIDRPAPSHS